MPSPSATPDKGGAKKTDPASIKAFLLQNTYDPSALIDLHIRDIAFDGNIEAKLLETFNSLHDSVSLLYADVEKEYNDLQIEAASANKSLLQELDAHSQKLQSTMEAVAFVQSDFLKASAEAVKIGEKLDIAEKERQRVGYGITLMDFIRFFETADSDAYESGSQMILQSISKRDTTSSEESVRLLLPPSLQTVEWQAISQVIYDLKKILYDINSDNVQRAQTNVMRLDQAIEQLLLALFDDKLTELQDAEDIARDIIIGSLKKYSECLFLFNSGISVQNRYQNNVLQFAQNRIPIDDDDNVANKRARKAFSVMNFIKKNPASFDETSSAGGTDDDLKGSDDEKASDVDVSEEDDVSEDEKKSAPGFFSFFSSGAKKTDKKEKKKTKKIVAVDISDLDQEASASQLLSDLITTIISVCQEQFAIIRAIFPVNAVARVTRSLIHLIFIDPHFGIASRIENILRPKYPKPPLEASSYLDALVIVKEKLSHLYTVLFEYCHQLFPQNQAIKVGDEEKVTQVSSIIDADEEQLKSEEDVKRFLEGQIDDVLKIYMSDYFEREKDLIRETIKDGLKVAVDDSKEAQLVDGGTITIKKVALRAEKLKTIDNIVKSVANSKFLNFLFYSTSEALNRMTVVARDDKNLPLKLKELYIMHEAIVIEGILVPIAQACKLMLLKHLTIKANNLPPIPPIEFISVLSFICNALNKLKVSFEAPESFAKYLISTPTLMAACKESRRKSTKNAEKVARDALHAWVLCIGSHAEKLLIQVQNKSDFFPKDELFKDGRGRSMSPSVACDATCKALLLVSNAIRIHSSNLHSLNLNESFWKPLGRQIIGVLISHFRRMKISPEGSKFVLIDMEEYYNVLQTYEAPENIDMIVCLREISLVYSAHHDDVAKMVVEDLRHLDTSVVLAMLRARSDSSTGKSGYWTRVLQGQFGKEMGNWELPLPWENKRNMGIIAFSQSAAAGAQSTALGPATLRKSTGFSQHFLSEITNKHLTNKQEHTTEPQSFTIGDEIKANAAQNKGNAYNQRQTMASSLRPEMSGSHDNEQFFRFEQSVNNANGSEDAEAVRNRLMMAEYRDYGKSPNVRATSSDSSATPSSALKAEKLKNAVFSFGNNITGKLQQMENAVKEGFDELTSRDSTGGLIDRLSIGSSFNSPIKSIEGSSNSNSNVSSGNAQSSNSATASANSASTSAAKPEEKGSFMGKMSSLFKF